MSTYTLQQQAFTLSMMSAQESGQTGTASALETALAGKIDGLLGNQSLINLIGQWSRVWGPVVWQNTAGGSNVADNTMFAGYNATENVYVVAVAGTNFTSAYDWKVEDLQVKQLLPWPGWDCASIAQGTQDGLNILLGMTDADGQTLGTYLENAAARDNARLVFTGHSLGGALAPALALALFDPLTQSGWQGGNLFVYPTAGPTPGNQEFANMFHATFPADPDCSGPNCFNVMVWNSLDLVPHTWAPTTFTADILENIYQPELAANACVQNLVALALTDPPAQDPYAQLPNYQFSGTFAAPASAFPDGTCAYLAQMIYQHTYAYYLALAPELLQEKILNPLNPLTGMGEFGMEYLYNTKIKPALEQYKICTTT